MENLNASRAQNLFFFLFNSYFLFMVQELACSISYNINKTVNSHVLFAPRSINYPKFL